MTALSRVLKRAANVGNTGFQHLGFQVVPSSRLRDLEAFHGRFAITPSHLELSDSGIEQHLESRQVRIDALSATNSAYPDAAPSLWGDELVERIDYRNFRADNMYVFQARNETSIFHCIESARYARQFADPLGLYNALQEDGAFGCCTVELEGKLLSRDLIDSLLELNFMAEVMGPSVAEARILDIGAGYGRLAHRVSTAWPDASVLCADAVPMSTFLQEFYIPFRELDRAQVLTLKAVDGLDSSSGIVAATNVHSFPECSIASIRWWLARLAAADVRYFFLVVDTVQKTRSREADGTGVEFLPEIHAAGYREVASRPKYDPDRIDARFMQYQAHYYAFERG